jgi:hypothetical protein
MNFKAIAGGITGVLVGSIGMHFLLGKLGLTTRQTDLQPLPRASPQQDALKESLNRAYGQKE